MRTLGAILAGGRSSRFGSDKAEAIVGGERLLDRVASRLRDQCDAVVVIGRAWPGLTDAPDLPEPGLGPMGGIAGALAWGRAQGYDQVLTSGCDLPDLPADLLARLSPGPAIVADMPVLGLWPCALADAALAWIAANERRSVRAWAEAVGARLVTLDQLPANINRPEDLAGFEDL